MAAVGRTGTLAFRVAYDAYGEARHLPAKDINGDGKVDRTDTTLAQNASGKTLGQLGYNPDADWDRDGKITSADIAQFGSRAYVTALPQGQLAQPGSATQPAAGLNTAAANAARAANARSDFNIGYCGYRFNGDIGAYTVRFRHYDPTPGMCRWLERDPAGYQDGPSLYSYLGRNPMAGTDPSGLASDDEAWRLDRDDHGAPHLQKGARRYDAQTFKPIRHLGETPQPLSERDLREIIEQGIVGQYDAKKVPLPAELQALRDGYGKFLKRGLKGKKAKLAAKALAKSIAKLGPLAIALFIHDLYASGAEAAVINAVIPADEIAELLRASQEAFAEWLDEAHFENQVERWMKTGITRKEAEREARDMIFREQMKRLDEVARQLRELDEETRCESR